MQYADVLILGNGAFNLEGYRASFRLPPSCFRVTRVELIHYEVL